MASSRKKTDDLGDASQSHATTRERRQTELENLALDLVERRLRSGEASSQETTHFLRSASTRGKIEELRLEHEIALMAAKKKQIESAEQLQNMFREAMAAYKGYEYIDPSREEIQ